MIARCELHHKSNDFHTALKDNVKVTDKTKKKAQLNQSRNNITLVSICMTVAQLLFTIKRNILLFTIKRNVLLFTSLTSRLHSHFWNSFGTCHLFHGMSLNSREQKNEKKLLLSLYFFIDFMRRALEKLILSCSSYEVYNTPQLPRNGWLHVSKDADNETECEELWSLDLSPVRQLSWKSCLNLTPSKGRTEWIKI